MNHEQCSEKLSPNANHRISAYEEGCGPHKWRVVVVVNGKKLDRNQFVAIQFKSFLFGNAENPEDLIIKLVLTWTTTKSAVYNMAPEEYLGTILKDRDFLKSYLLIKGAFRGRDATYQDVIERPPGIELLENLRNESLGTSSESARGTNRGNLESNSGWNLYLFHR